MLYLRHLFAALTLFALSFSFANQSYAATTSYSGTFAGDNTVVTIGFSTATTQQYTFSTTSYARGGFVPVLTLFSALGGNPLAVGETGGDVSFTQALGAGSYLLALTENANMFSSTYAGGTSYASPTATGDFCHVSGGKFLDVSDGCGQRTSSYAVSIQSAAIVPAATPEPSTWVFVMPALALLLFIRYKRISL